MSFHFTGEELLLEKCKSSKDTRLINVSSRPSLYLCHRWNHTNHPSSCIDSASRLSDRYHSMACETATLPPSTRRENHAQPLRLHNWKEAHIAMYRNWTYPYPLAFWERTWKAVYRYVEHFFTAKSFIYPGISIFSVRKNDYLYKKYQVNSVNNIFKCSFHFRLLCF